LCGNSSKALTKPFTRFRIASLPSLIRVRNNSTPVLMASTTSWTSVLKAAAISLIFFNPSSYKYVYTAKENIKYSDNYLINI
jgi:hypothetical protein